jgi:hypothetical protein
MRISLCQVIVEPLLNPWSLRITDLANATT